MRFRSPFATGSAPRDVTFVPHATFASSSSITQRLLVYNLCMNTHRSRDTLLPSNERPDRLPHPALLLSRKVPDTTGANDSSLNSASASQRWAHDDMSTSIIHTFHSPPEVVSAASPSPRLGTHHPSSRLASRARQRQAHDAALRDRSSPGNIGMGAARVIGGNYACSSSEDANLTRPLKMSQRPRPHNTGRRSSVRPGWSPLAVVDWREQRWQDE
jgi:hypothetical protein